MQRALRILASMAILAGFTAIGCRQRSPREEDKSERGFALPDGSPESGREAFVALRCYACHEVDGLEGELPRPVANPQTGVKLGGLAMREPADGELVTSIVNPSHKLYPAGEGERIASGEGSRMANLNESMTVQNLIDIVAFLHERYQTARTASERRP
jgi:hypothetical protein